MAPFEFATATRIVFGPGVIAQLPAIVKDCGRRVLLVTGKDSGRADRISSLLREHAIDCTVFPVAGEPSIALVESGVAAARGGNCEVVLAVGGGSVIDAGKAMAALLTNPGEIFDYLEVVGRGQPLTVPPAPFIAAPTTAGTGAEVTRNAVLSSPEHRVKASLRSPLMLPRVALIDPELALRLPRHITAFTGLDALTQLIEPFVSPRANAFTDLFCREGIRRAAEALPAVWEDGGNLATRTSMSFSSLLGGLALANAGLGAVHGFAAPIGGMFDAPHGAACAALLPHVMEVNLRALGARDAGNPALPRYQEVACLLTGRTSATAAEGVEWVASLCRRLMIPALGSYGIQDSDIPTLVEKAARASSMKANPIVLTYDELTEILRGAL